MTAWLDAQRSVAWFDADDDAIFIEPYEGRDSNLLSRVCAGPECEKFTFSGDMVQGEVEPFRICSRCRLVHYCSVDCQRVHFPEHKGECKCVKKARDKTDALEAALRGGPIQPWDRNEYTKFSGERMNYYEDDELLGNWWLHIDPRDFCRSTFSLSEEIIGVNWHLESESVWKQALDLLLELMRVNVADNLGVRGNIPSVMLFLNRDDQCLQFIKWQSYNYKSKYVRIGGDESHILPVWGKGVFIFEEAGGNRLDDLCPFFNDDGEEIPGYDYRNNGALCNTYDPNKCSVDMKLNFMVALVVIKLRVVQHLRSQERLALGKSPLAEDPSRLVIRAALGMDHQAALLRKYLKAIHRMNRFMLHLLCDNIEAIKAIREQGSPKCYGRGSVEEAALSMEQYLKHVSRVPGGPLVIKQFLTSIGETKTPNLEFDRSVQY